MKEYTHYNALEFVQDEQFVKWVKYAGLYPELDSFWQSWLDRHPHKAQDVAEAREMILAILEEGEAQQVARREAEGLARLRASLDAETEQPVRRSLWHRPFRVAASVVIVLTIACLVWVVARFTADAPVLTQQVPAGWVREVNRGALPRTLVLSDGSSIILQPGSAVEYPRVFGKERREVALTGEGFFEIARNPAHPFFVYADQVVTRVLGTSFTIRAVAGEKNISVRVRTGKVSVFTRPEPATPERAETAPFDGVLLVPNQQAVYVRAESRLTKSLVDEPAIVDAGTNPRFEFRDTPLRDVFAGLERAYGIDILYDEELFSDCLVNISLEDMPLYDKMRLICKTIEADYQILDSHIVVTGKGCRD